MTAPDPNSSSAARPDIPSYAAYAQLIRMLLPSTGAITFYDTRCELAWCSDGYERLDLRELVETFSAQAHAVERNKGSVRRTADGVTALVARLSDPTGRDFGYALIELGPAHSIDHSMAVSLSRPLLEILGAHLAAMHDLQASRGSDRRPVGGPTGVPAAPGMPETRRPEASGMPAVPAARPATNAPSTALAVDRAARFELLLRLAEIDLRSSDSVQRLLDRCVAGLGLASAAFCIPSQGLTVVAEPASSEPEQRRLVDSTRRHLLAWAQLNSKPIIVNRVGADAAKARFKILSCPIPGPDGRSGGLLALFRPSHDEDFEPVDVGLAEFVSRQALTVLRERRDAATGLASAAAFGRALADRLAADAVSSLLQVQIEELRSVDDRRGPDVGDEILDRVAELIQRRLRPDDLAWRWPDGRFLVLLPDRAGSEARTFAAKLAERAATLDYRDDRQTVRVSLRCGVAERPDGSKTARQWIAATTRALEGPEIAAASTIYNVVPV